MVVFFDIQASPYLVATSKTTLQCAVDACTDESSFSPGDIYCLGTPGPRPRTDRPASIVYIPTDGTEARRVRPWQSGGVTLANSAYILYIDRLVLLLLKPPSTTDPDINPGGYHELNGI